MINIALDQSVGKIRAKELEKLGYNVVCIAEHGESDVDWMNRAFINHALFVVSPDMDIPKLIEKEGYPMVWINYPSDVPELKDNLVQYIHNRINIKRYMFGLLKDNR
jgi:hypothetical protein